VRHLSAIPKALYYGQLARADGTRHVHAHWATVSTSAAMLMSRVSGIAYSFTGHAWDIFSETELLPTKIRNAQFVLTCTDFNRQHLLGVAGGPSEKIHVVYHGVQLPEKQSPSPERTTRTAVILTVGRWTEKKGFAELIEALARVRNAGFAFELRIVAGPGSRAYERSVQQSIDDLGLRDRVTTLPWMAQSDVLDLMRQSDLFVLPCVKDSNGVMDGIPNVLIEALSVDLPVVATRLSGIPELVRHRETGLLVEERDTEELAAGIIWCLEHPAEAKHLAEAGRRLVARMFDMNHTISSLEEHLRNAIARHGRATASPLVAHQLE